MVEPQNAAKTFNFMKAIHIISWVLIIIGALNWGLVGLGELSGVPGGWNVVDMLLNSWPTVEQLVYVLVGLAGLWELFMHRKQCKTCSSM